MERSTGRPRRWQRAAALAMLAVVVAFPVAADTIVEWDLANATGQSASVLDTHVEVGATAIQAAGGLSEWASTAQDGFIAASGWAPGLAPDPSLYYEWTITPNAGFSIDYETITLALFRGIQGANHGAELWDLHASTDAFATSDLYLQTFDISSSAVDEQTVFSDADISAIGTVATAVTFRLFGYDYTSASDFSGLGNDSGWLITGTGVDPIVEGTVFATPEPGTALLLGFGLVWIAFSTRGASSSRNSVT